MLYGSGLRLWAGCLCLPAVPWVQNVVVGVGRANGRDKCATVSYRSYGSVLCCRGRDMGCVVADMRNTCCRLTSRFLASIPGWARHRYVVMACLSYTFSGCLSANAAVCSQASPRSVPMACRPFPEGALVPHSRGIVYFHNSGQLQRALHESTHLPCYLLEQLLS